MTQNIFEWLGWERTYTKEEVLDLLERVKIFNAGVIDEHLTRHVDRAFNQWLQEKK
jgi:hypothetical protein